MDMEIQEYIELIKRHDPCKEGVELMEVCSTRYDLYKLSLSPVCTGWFLNSIRDGWGLSIDDISRLFSRYVNGGMTVKEILPSGRALCSQMWTGKSSVILDDEVCRIILLGFKGKVHVMKKYGFLEVYAGPETEAVVSFCDSGLMLLRQFGGNVKGTGCKIRQLNTNKN